MFLSQVAHAVRLSLGAFLGAHSHYSLVWAMTFDWVLRDERIVKSMIRLCKSYGITGQSAIFRRRLVLSDPRYVVETCSQSVFLIRPRKSWIPPLFAGITGTIE